MIPKDGGMSKYKISEEDCINYTFSRTKIEDVFSKVEFKYKWDYAKKNLMNFYYRDSRTISRL